MNETPTSRPRTIRLKKSNEATTAAMPEHSEAKESSWYRHVRPRVWRTTIAATLLISVGLVAYRMAEHQWWAILCIFTAALVIGESLELKLVNRPPIPISFAFITALARTTTNAGSFSWIHACAVIVAAVTISTLCYSHVRALGRLKVFSARLVTYLAGTFVARVLFDQIAADSQWRYAILIGSVITMLGIHELLAWVDGFPRVYGFFAAAGHASIVAGGVLIGIGYGGNQVVTSADLARRAAQSEAGESIRTIAEAGGNGLGISALITCAIPLLVAWFAFARYYQALMTYKQTIRALSTAPELGGIVAWGHADRVARIALAVADRLDLDREDLQQIETAAYMHTLGDAVLDTTMEVDPVEEAQAAHVTADIVRSAGGLDRVADIIDEHVEPYRGVRDGQLVAQNDIAASVLRVANDYDNISRREETWGKRALQSMLDAPSATYNPRALEALEWVLSRDRYADLVEPPEMPAHVQQLLTS